MRTNRGELFSEDGAVRGEDFDLIRTGEEVAKLSAIVELRLHDVTAGPAGDDARAARRQVF
jgi:methylglyoxal synthase